MIEKIEKVEAYKVGSSLYETEEEAKKKMAMIELNTLLFRKNLNDWLSPEKFIKFLVDNKKEVIEILEREREI